MTEWLRLRHVAETVTSNVDKRESENEIPVRLINYTDVYYGDRLTPDIPLMWATASASEIAKHRVAGGDVLITKDSETADDIGIAAFVESSADDIVCGYHLSRIRAHTATVDPRYLFWTLTGSYARDQMSVAATGVTRFGLRADSIRDLSIRVPPLPEQRAIADYLDNETSRIDTLITKKRRMIELLEERRAGTVEARIRELAARHGESPLKFHTPRVLVGIVVTPAAFYADSGIPALRGVNIRPGYLDLDDLVYLSEDAHILHSKSRLFQGDIVVVRTGQAGAACVVPPDLDGSNCVDLLIVRSSSELNPRYLEYVINSDWTIKHIEEHSVGSIQSHFNVESLRQLPIPVPSLDVQQETVEALDHATGQIDSLLQRLGSQIKLLTERRQALITAAVTGESPIPGMAARRRQVQV